MNPEFRRVKEIFLAAVEQPGAAERDAYLREACGPDEGLRRQVEALLARHAQAGSFLEPPTGSPVLIVADRPVEEGPGTVVGPYRLLEEIGEGGFGVVYMAEQQQPVRRKVALKVLKPGMDTRQVVARFEAERQALAIMDHPNIAKVFDGGATPSGRPYFVMELVKGMPITEFCDQSHLTPRHRLELFLPVCRAVQHAHQKGIIHRDLKPSNVLVVVHDTRPVPKVIDFGVAKALGQNLTDKTLFTGFAQMVGTPLYMSPEQAGLSGLDIDTRTDIYSLGVLLYELLTGTTPFRRERFKQAGYEEIRRIIRDEEPPRPSTRLSESKDTLPAISTRRQTEPARLARLVRGELDWIVMKALEKDRNRRYETANALALDVQRYLTDEPVLACPPSAGYRLRKFVRRNKGRLAIAASVFLAVAVMGASVSWAVRDRAARGTEAEHAELARRAGVAVQVRDSLRLARTLIAESKLASARQKLVEARAQLGSDAAVLDGLAAEVEANVAELDRFQQFLDLIDRAHQAETSPFLELTLTADGSDGHVGGPAPAKAAERQPAAAVPFLLEALRRYGVLERDDWIATLAGSLLGPQQVEHVRRFVYEELLWLADDLLRRAQEHGTGRTLSPEAAVRQALLYLNKAESAQGATQALHVLRARCHRFLKEDAAAKADTELADQTPPRIALDHFLRGQAAFDAKRLAEGVQAFEAALRLEPTHYWSMMELGYCLTDLGQGPEDFAGAARVFTGCILKRPDHAHAYFCRANAYIKLRRYEEALADQSRAIELDPHHAPAWHGRGVAYQKLGQSDKAVADCSRAIELDPKYVGAWVTRGSAYNQLGQPDRAVADCSRALELDPNNAFAWNNRGLAYLSLGQPGKALADCSKAVELAPKHAPVWYNRGNVCLRLGQPDKAVADYSRALELDAKHLRAWNNRGLAYFNLGQPDKAVADHSRALELNPQHRASWINRGRAYYSLRQYDSALADYSRALELDANDAEAWASRGAAYFKLGRQDEAVADFTRALSLNPESALAWYNRADAYRTLGQPEKAVVDYSRAIELNPKDTRAWNGRGIAYNKLGQSDKAVADYSQVLDLDPKFTVAWANRGNAYRKLNQPEKALPDYCRAIELDPKYTNAWRNRGLAYLELDQPEKAVADFARVVQLAPQEAIGWQFFGMAHYRAGDWKAAVAALAQSLKLPPGGDGRNWLFLAMAHQKLGNYDEARKAYEQGVRWQEQNQEALAKDKNLAEELRRLQAEAEEVLQRKP